MTLYKRIEFCSKLKVANFIGTYFTGFLGASKLHNVRVYDVAFLYGCCLPADIGMVQSSDA